MLSIRLIICNSYVIFDKNVGSERRAYILLLALGLNISKTGSERRRETERERRRERCYDIKTSQCKNYNLVWFRYLGRRRSDESNSYNYVLCTREHDHRTSQLVLWSR